MTDTAAFEPENLNRWTMPSNYFGEVWPAYYSAGVGQSRDSDALERSNFRSMLKAIGGESETVQVVRESHWAVGWVEWIAIHQDDETALRKADEIKGALEDYPVINEDDWSEEETSEANDVWRDCYSVAERVKYIRDHRSQFEFHDWQDMRACVRGDFFAGYASELLF
ncbi:hypothetical protein [Bradyrhizobium sp. STM 3557]|uniref:hypothetical protein n=1 Tax=Bradyrhizobium sp. STM 3557 TaxID=578920 RepID=UPI003890866D